MACSGPAHRKCKKIVTFEEKDKFLGLHKNESSENVAQKHSAPKEQMRSQTEMAIVGFKPRET